MIKRYCLALCTLAAPAMAEVPNVVTDIAPVQGLAAQVLKGLGTPELIVARGASPHDYALRPSNARALFSADLVFWVGPDLTPGLEKSLLTLAESAVQIELLDADVTQRRMWRDTFESDEGHGLEEHATEEHHSHDHDAADPHAWLDPENGKAWLTLMAEALSTQDPENAATYRANAAEGRAEIDAATAEITARLTPLTDRPYVVFHDAYQYFEGRFGLHPVGAISLGDAADPSPARISALRQTLQDTGATCVFSEPEFNAGLVETVFEGSNARTAVIDPLGTTIEPGPGFYPALMRQLAQSMAACL